MSEERAFHLIQKVTRTDEPIFLHKEDPIPSPVARRLVGVVNAAIKKSEKKKGAQKTFCLSYCEGMTLMHVVEKLIAENVVDITWEYIKFPK